MTREQIRDFVDRDWDLIAETKIAAWRDRDISLREGFEAWYSMWRYVRKVRPDWPTEDSRAEDLASHQHVAELFHRASQAVRSKAT